MPRDIETPEERQAREVLARLAAVAIHCSGITVGPYGFAYLEARRPLDISPVVIAVPLVELADVIAQTIRAVAPPVPGG